LFQLRIGTFAQLAQTSFQDRKRLANTVLLTPIGVY
jgi:hypothetical protein